MNETEKNPVDEALILEAAILEALPAATRTYSSLRRIEERDATFLTIQNELLDLLLKSDCWPTPSAAFTAAMEKIDPETWHTARATRRKRLHGLATLNAHYIQEHYLAYTGCFELTVEGRRS